ncbi:MucB/RseB C-terminal domain-containing protein [Halomonas sabkhae]|uniref:MucB/RseB C-terminal domain-containing protein n=1 Tax=Halomonas sabkhae TaxID=626223 RepID=UPI0025B44A73|nr:MucB/RseB C-terminal domain-containing protein [Halomonas sabkhae]MDN3526127.1 MucB/RseB C-terminal domain-containing protein [Halomonas sabkhae]
MWQWGTRSRRWRLVGAILAGVMAWPAMAQQATDDPASALQCAGLDEREAPASAREWFTRSRLASHCYIYQARAVRIGSSGVRTLAISHDVQQGVEQEVARFLDGPPVVHERRGGIVHPGDDTSAATALASAESVNALYRLRMAGDARIAGRSARILEIEPLDDQRYGRRLWLDADTMLPLKQMLLDERGRAIETFQMTELRDPRLYRGDIEASSPQTPSRDAAWQPGWLPEGFEPRAVSEKALGVGSGDQQLYGDGLATLSLFVETVAGQQLLKPGLHRLGVSHAAVRHREMGGEPRQVVVLGEMPPGVLQRVAESIEWQGGQSTAAVSQDSRASP